MNRKKVLAVFFQMCWIVAQLSALEESNPTNDVSLSADEAYEAAVEERVFDESGNFKLTSCAAIRAANRLAPSGTYSLMTSYGISVPIYCEMGLNGGAYTFLHPMALPYITNTQLQAIFNDRSTFLLRARRTDGTQPYAVLRQLPQYWNIPLKLGLNDNSGYNSPVNRLSIGQPYLYYGFLPITRASSNSVQGLRVNSFSNTFTNCDRNPNSYIAIFPNFREVSLSTYDVPGSVCNNIINYLQPNPSSREMPEDFFMFAETHWGGCGCYKQTNRISGIISFAIGFR